jgi:hypothetical protein
VGENKECRGVGKVGGNNAGRTTEGIKQSRRVENNSAEVTSKDVEKDTSSKEMWRRKETRQKFQRGQEKIERSAGKIWNIAKNGEVSKIRSNMHVTTHHKN